MLSKLLKKFRENSGYTQQQVADALNIDRSTYAYYELGKTTPDINTITKLAKIFNVSYIDLLDDEEFCEKPLILNDNIKSYKNLYEDNETKFIYELSKKEKSLVGLFRVLTESEQQEILNDIIEKVELN